VRSADNSLESPLQTINSSFVSAPGTDPKSRRTLETSLPARGQTATRFRRAWLDSLLVPKSVPRPLSLALSVTGCHRLSRDMSRLERAKSLGKTDLVTMSRLQPPGDPLPHQSRRWRSSESLSFSSSSSIDSRFQTRAAPRPSLLAPRPSPPVALVRLLAQGYLSLIKVIQGYSRLKIPPLRRRGGPHYVGDIGVSGEKTPRFFYGLPLRLKALGNIDY
jgi:hypothetical protein